MSVPTDTETLRQLCDEQAKTIRRQAEEISDLGRKWYAVQGVSASRADTIDELAADLAAAKAQVERLTKALDDLAYLSRNCTTTRIILRNRIQAALADTAPMAKPGDPGHFGPHDGGTRSLDDTAPSGEIMRLDSSGMTYKGQRIEDGGEAHRALLEALKVLTMEKEPSGEGVEEPVRQAVEMVCESRARMNKLTREERAELERKGRAIINAPKPPSDILTTFREHMAGAVTLGEINQNTADYVCGILDGVADITTKAAPKPPSGCLLDKLERDLVSIRDSANEMGAGYPPDGYDDLEDAARKVADECYNDGLDYMKTAISNWIYDQRHNEPSTPSGWQDIATAPKKPCPYCHDTGIIKTPKPEGGSDVKECLNCESEPKEGGS